MSNVCSGDASTQQEFAIIKTLLFCVKETLSKLAYSVWAQHPWLVCMCLSVSLSISIRKVPMFGLEAIFRNGVPVGHLRRSDYGFFIDKTIGYGYIRSPDGGVVKTLDTQHLHIYSHTVSLSVMSLILSYLCFVSWAVVFCGLIFCLIF